MVILLLDGEIILVSCLGKWWRQLSISLKTNNSYCVTELLERLFEEVSEPSGYWRLISVKKLVLKSVEETSNDASLQTQCGSDA